MRFSEPRPLLVPFTEMFAGLEAAELYRSSVWRGDGVSRGNDDPVFLVPGFLAGDGSLAIMTRWLRSIGYRTRRAGMKINASCSEQACAALEPTIERMAETSGRRVAIVGQSRGGVFAKTLATARPDLVSGIVTLGSPTVPTVAPSPMVALHALTAAALMNGHLPGLLSWRCVTGSCGDRFRRALREPFPADVAYVSVYSRHDALADWQACCHPAASNVEVRSSHLGMAMNRHVFAEVARALELCARGGEDVRRVVCRQPAVSPSVDQGGLRAVSGL